MKQTRPTDHIASALTDLMTSLMVIFVLLLVTKLNNQAGQRAAAAADLQDRLQKYMRASGQQATVGRAKDDPNTLVINIPNTLISFDSQDYQLKSAGRQFLANHIPSWAGILCSAEVRPNVDTIVVEGHADQTRWQNSTFEESNEKNLTLSQQRSMAVVSDSLDILKASPAARDCFLEKLSATGRGEQDPADPQHPDSVENRRVVFKIRLRPDLVPEVVQSLDRTIRP